MENIKIIQVILESIGQNVMAPIQFALKDQVRNYQFILSNHIFYYGLFLYPGSGQINRITNCPSTSDLNHDLAEERIKLDTAVSRKRKLFGQPEREKREWLSTDEFDNNWLVAIKTSNLIPVEEVEKNKHWFHYLPASEGGVSRFRCRTCHEYADIFNIRPQHRSLLSYAKGHLYESKNNNRNAIRYHEQSPGHSKIVERLQQSFDGTDFYNHVAWNEEEHMVVTTRVMRSVYTAVRHLAASYNSMKYLITLQEQHGLNLGTQCKSRQTHTEMTAIISRLMHDKLIESIKTNGNPLSIIVDASTDKGNIHQLVVLFHTLENEVPNTYLYGLLPLGTVTTAQAQTDVLIDQLKKDGMYDHVKNHIISFVSDGARRVFQLLVCKA